MHQLQTRIPAEVPVAVAQLLSATEYYYLTDEFARPEGVLLEWPEMAETEFYRASLVSKGVLTK
jgi:hypothetical protein